jgi:tetratricopeptide (TPR) repeat protein
VSQLKQQKAIASRILLGLAAVSLTLFLVLRMRSLDDTMQLNRAFVAWSHVALPATQQPNTLWDIATAESLDPSAQDKLLGMIDFRLNDTDQRAIYFNGLRLIALQAFDSAETALAQASPTANKMTLFLQGIVAENQQQTSQATEFWARAQAGHALVERAELYRQRAQYDDAIRSLMLAVDTFLQSGADDLELAQAYGQLGRIYKEHFADNDSARTAFKNAIKYAPDNAHFQAQLGLTLMLLNQPRQSITYFERATLLEPLRPEYRVWLGESYRAVGQSNQAEAAFLAAQQLDNAAWHARASHELAILFRNEEQLQQALAASETAVLLMPETVDYRLLKAQILADMGQSADAEAELQRALQTSQSAELGKVYFELGLLQSELSDFQAAGDAFAEVVRLDPENHYARLLSAEAYVAANQLPRATELLTVGLHLFPGQPELLVALDQLMPANGAAE